MLEKTGSVPSRGQEHAEEVRRWVEDTEGKAPVPELLRRESSPKGEGQGQSEGGEGGGKRG